MTKERLDEIRNKRDIPNNLLYFAIEECVNEIERLNKLVEQLRQVHHEYIQAMIERDLNT